MPSDALLGTVLAALIAATPPCILAYLAFMQSKKATAASEAAKAETTATKTLVEASAAELKEVGLKVDGRFDKLVEDIRMVAFAEGKAEGVTATEAIASEATRIAAQSATDHAAGLAEGRAETRP